MKARYGCMTAVAAAMAVCSGATLSGETASENVFLGSWAGTTKNGLRLEAVIKGIGEDRWVTGVGCWRAKSGLISGARLDGRARLAKNELSVTVKYGKIRYTMVRLDEERMVIRKRLLEDGPNRPPRMRVEVSPATELTCANRFAESARTLKATGPDATHRMVGVWTGQWPNGNLTELAVEKVDGRAKIEGRMCTKRPASGAITILDVEKGGPLRTKYWQTKDRLRIEQEAGWGRKHRYVFTVGEGGTMQLESTRNYGAAEVKTWKLDMVRGAHPDGCLRETYPKQKVTRYQEQQRTVGEAQGGEEGR